MRLGVLFRYLSGRTEGNCENSHLHFCEWRLSALELRYFNGLFFYVLVLTLRLVLPSFPFHAAFSSFCDCLFLSSSLACFLHFYFALFLWLFFFPLHLSFFLCFSILPSTLLIVFSSFFFSFWPLFYFVFCPSLFFSRILLSQYTLNNIHRNLFDHRIECIWLV